MDDPTRHGILTMSARLSLPSATMFVNELHIVPKTSDEYEAISWHSLDNIEDTVLVAVEVVLKLPLSIPFLFISDDVWLFVGDNDDALNNCVLICGWPLDTTVISPLFGGRSPPLGFDR